MSRIKLHDTGISAITKMSDGNPGALDAMMQLLTPKTKEIDPDAFMGGMGCILALDTLEIYGTDIYILFNDICDRDLVKMITVLRAHQLGFIQSEVIRSASGRQDRSGRSMIDVDALYEKVVKELPNFNKIEA